MRVNSVKFLCDAMLIDIDTGRTVNILSGARRLVQAVIHEGREYLIFVDNRIGSTTSYMLEMERDQIVELTRVPDDNDPTYDGIPLPLKSSAQTKENSPPIAHLIKGVVYCEKCSLSRSLTYPDAIAMYPKNILPMDQDCHCCGQMLVQIGRKPTNIMIKKFVKPEKGGK